MRTTDSADEIYGRRWFVMMKRGLLVAALLASAMTVSDAGHVLAAGVTVNPSTFATSPIYCGTGGFTLSGSLRVLGPGTGTFAGGCAINMADNARLTISNATLQGSGGDFGVLGGAHAKVRVRGSTITMSGSNRVILAPGFTKGSVLGGDGATVKVINSTLTGDGVGILPSCDHNLGKAIVRKSSLSAAGTMGTFSIIVAASSDFCGVSSPTGGKVRLTTSTLDAGPIGLLVLSDGKTRLTKSTLRFGSIKIHGGLRCRSSGNTPVVACS